MVKRFLSTVIIGAMAIVAMAQTNIRYVCNSNGAVKNPSTNAVIGYHVKGAYTNDGKSWATAKDNIQDAINDLKNNNLDGEVWVAQGTYYPTETTESTGGSTLYMSFKIPAGITVRGGFKGLLTSQQLTLTSNQTVSLDSDGKVIVTTTATDGTKTTSDPYDATAGESKTSDRTKISNSTSSVGYYYPFQSVLDGSISASHKQPKFTWNSTKHQYTTEFYGNCYHVVTFATNGFDSNGRANPLGTTAEISAANGEMAKLEGFMVKNGYAYNSSTDGHPHNAYGGGVYMVPGACLEDVAVENCEASRDGGGVYLDGGGKCVHVYVADCQAVGTSYSSGYGGGICVDENKQVFPPIVKRSATINCVARYGGGIANRVNNPSLKITAGSKTYQMRYNQGFAACVVSGCTALTEGGGIYALNGGSFTHMTVARNACYGSGITVNGMKTGRSAGFYARNNVVMANSILWGGSINDDQTKAAQFASSRSTTDDKAETYYVALSNADRADWTGVKATGTIKLSRYNTSSSVPSGTTVSSEEGYVNFLNPLSAAGHSEGAAASHFKAYEKNSTTNNGISYKVDYTSACTNAGVPTTDIDTEGRTPATKDGQTDVFGDEYSSNPTLGAYTSTVPVMGPDVEDTGEDMTTPGGHTYRKGVVHIFVDPNSTYSGTSERLGCSWATPVKSLRDAIEQIDSRAQDLVALIESGTSSVFTGSVEKVVIHVKEGTTTVQGANVSGTIRSTSLEMPNLTVHHTYLENGEQKQETETSNLELEIIGGYKSNITDNIYSSTNTSGYDNTTANFPARHGYAQASVRNPILYPTIITGYVMDDYEYTTPHIFKIEDKGTTPVTIDGLQVRYANATSQKLDNTVTTGAAFTIKNSSAVSLKNVLIADCQASNGAAIYATGNSAVSLENCIIHNNAVNVAGVSGGDFNKGGIIYAERGSSVTLNHCDVLRNVGYAFYNDGTVTMDNSICYANMSTALDDTNGNADKALKTFAGSGTVSSLYNTADDKYNLFDTGSASDTKATGIGNATQVFVFEPGIQNHYPAFMNPTKNAGISENGDATYYGKSSSFEPQNSSDVINSAYYSGDHLTWGTDMSAYTTRDFGGIPDIGAVESHIATSQEAGDNANSDGQPVYGTLYYVKDYRKGDGTIDFTSGGDGTSWKNAINGNAFYSQENGAIIIEGTSQGHVKYWGSEAVVQTVESAGSSSRYPTYSTVNNSNPIYMKIKNPYYGTYLKYDLASNSFKQVSTFEKGDKFILVGSTNYGYGSGNGMYIYDATAGKYIGYEVSNSGTKSVTVTMTISESQPQNKWSVSNGMIYYYDYYSDPETTTQTGGKGQPSKTLHSKVYHNSYFYLQVGSNSVALSLDKVTTDYTSTYTTDDNNKNNNRGPNTPGQQNSFSNSTSPSSSNANTWNYVLITTSNTSTGETVEKWLEKEVTDGLNGLQYAVNKANKEYKEKNLHREVWVAAGTYAKDNESGDQSCFMIRDGVDVYGAFPKTGNPCKNQRNPLVSQYVKVINGLDYDDYETILEPITQTIASGSTRRVLGQSWDYAPNNDSKVGDFNGAIWDGFTLRNGVLDASQLTKPAGCGGAGACFYNNVKLKNAVVTNCTTFYPNAGSVQDFRAGGVYMYGGTFEEGYIINNNLYDQVTTSDYWGTNTNISTSGGAAYGGGLYLYEGTVFNSVIANNKITANYADGAGMFVETANFFNNTIVNNYAQGSVRCSGGVTVYRDNNKSEAESSILHMTNCIIVNNSGNQNSGWYGQKQGTKDVSINNSGKIYLDNCITETQNSSSSDIVYNDATLLTTDFVSLFDNGTTGIGSYGTNFTTLNLRLTKNSPAINAGIDQPTINGKLYDLTTYTDMDYEDRVQDCTIDVGAYEYNDAYAITPDEASEDGKAIYYVTPEGYGTASAADPANAACAAKLQKVIDAAGRYKYSNPTKQVIVKVANSYSMLHPSEGDASNFTYYACRTTDDEGSGQDVRIWSIIVPRGVEVWGGYTDVASDQTKASWSNTDNGFYSRSGSTYTDLRDVISNPTYFNAQYTNKDENTQAYAYHVVSFTNKVYDGNGKPYKTNDPVTGNSTYGSSTADTYMRMPSSVGRAVIDGIFITGGTADANTTTKDNTNIYGGAALVTEYAHVRNCIVRDNEGNYGGGLALTKGALVSGCLIDQNTANNKGGGIYVLTDEENTNIGITSTEKPHVYTSTIVNNTASVIGGGIAFDDKDNVRVNSSVIWQNHCQDMANVSGSYAPEKAATESTAAIDYYPIAYSAIQNLRASGTNNISIATENKSGARFWQNYKYNSTTKTYDEITSETAIADEADFNEFGLYKPTNISALLRVGMPVSSYDALVTSDGLAENDFAALSRKAASTGIARTYIDMGARALDKKLNDKQLMLRLFVAQPEDVDADAATEFATLTGNSGSPEEYYSQQGSSFAYPFQDLQDALDYIYTKRGLVNNGTTIYVDEPTDNANLMPFEICVAKGTYYPTEQPDGTYGQSYSNTFAIPEGVNIYGGFDVSELGDNIFYGRYYKAKSTNANELPVNYSKESTSANSPSYIASNVTFVNANKEDGKEILTDKKQYVANTEIKSGYTIKEASTDILLSDRVREDVNANSIIEPWEFKYQTTLSGASVGDESNGVFHVISAFPDQLVTGVLPPKSVDLSSTYDAADNTSKKYMNHEHGQYSVLNGLVITGGSAKDFHLDENMNTLSKYNYYHGGGLLADGNVYNNDYNNGTTEGTIYKHTGVTNAVAYRDEIICINQCKFIDNEAGYGGAMSVNTTVDVYNSTFEENLATYGVDSNVPKDGSTISIKYPGQGGAIFSTHQFAAYNTVFANNEARDDVNYTLDGIKCPSYRNPDESTLSYVNPGAGGAIYSGIHGQFHLINCDMVRNMANMFPCVATKNPNTYTDAEATACSINDYNQFLNTVAWGNELNSTMYNKFSNNTYYTFGAQLICNYGAPNRSKSTAYTANFTADGGMPTSLADLNNATKFAETAWFSAYEEGRGKSCINTVDLRDKQFRPNLHATAQIQSNGGAANQNCNVLIDSENSTLEGPNFSAPSKTAGLSGYSESADWSPARLSNMTDQGSGRIIQQVTKNTDQTYTCNFPTYTEAGYASVAAYDADRTAYSNETTSDYVTSGAYTTTRYMISTNYANTIPVGNDYYMKQLLNGTNDQMMYRISYDPNPSHAATYIDIGVYEYQHSQLKYDTEGDECDVLWVSTLEKPDNGLPDGSSWSKPTSDLQRAIETLLSSRNGHRKEIRLMDGTYAPIYTIEGKQSFYFDTKYINGSVVLPYSNNTATEGLGVKSFTIKGGYSKDLNDQYDVDEYPAIIRQKKQTQSGTTRWDHLFYIKDATQRYGCKTAYNSGNGYGWWAGTTAAGTAAASGTAPTTIPIEIDGVSLVNNQTSENVVGAAVYYADQAFNANCEQTDNATNYLATSPKTANISVLDPDGKKVDNVKQTNPYKLIISKSTIMNTRPADISKKTTSAAYIGKFGGQALVYNSVFHSNRGDALDAYATRTVNNTFALNTGMLKLMDKTGNSTYDAAHSYNSTIYNSVFWKNNNGGSGTTYGKQFNLVASSSKTYDGTVGTDGTIASTYKCDYIQSNAYTGGNNEAVDYDATENNVIKANNWNTGLVNSNSDATYGPNFIDPAETATTDDAIEARNFMLKPSMRLLNHGDNNTANVTAVADGTAFYYAKPLTGTTLGSIYDYAWIPSTNTDAASQTRVIASGGKIDLGAFEYQSKQNRVLYVDPNKLTSGDGNSWGDAFGYGDIQTAIDACAVYFKNEHRQTYVFVKANSSTNLGMHTQEKLTMRNGVAVYGNVLSDYNTDCYHSTDAAGDYYYSDNDLTNYVRDIKILHRNGVASPIEGHTRILGINTYGAFDAGNTCINGTGSTPNAVPISVMDGFDVTAQTDANSSEMATVAEPVIDINPKKDDTQTATGGLKMAISNVIVHDNDISASSANLIYINNALLYEALVYNNKVNSSWSALEVGEYGYAASVTVEGKTEGADNSTTLNNVSGSDNATSGNTTASHVYNSITNYSDDAATWKTLSGYCYKMDKPALNYQLTETSKYIDAISVTNGSEQSVLGGTAAADYKSGGMPANLSCFINYWPERNTEGTSWTKADRDLLGNFRLQTLGTVAGDGYDGNDYSSDGTTAYQPKLDRGAFETWDIKQSTKNCYPDFSHAGSVEYIRAGKSFIIDGIAEGGNNNPHNPGFVLLEMGANLYGNGRRVEIPYISVESYVSDAFIKTVGTGYVMSAPFKMNYNKATEITSGLASFDKGVAVCGMGQVSYDGNGGLLYNKLTNVDTYTYNGTDRSASDYAFETGVTTQSSCWKSTTGEIPAATGILMVYNSVPSGTIKYRVTAYSGAYETKVYKEEINFNNNHVYHSVPLYKYNDSESTDGGADFTDANDQGWNCIGLPYLVCNYHPYYKAVYNSATSKVTTLAPDDDGYAAATTYAMTNPKTMWLYYNGKVDGDGNRLAPDGTSTTMGDGGFYAVNSWDNTSWHQESGTTPRIWMGEGFFVQNQDWEGDEELKFYVPVAPELPINAVNGAKKTTTESFNTRYYYETDITAPTDNGDERTYKIRVINRTLTVSNLEGGENIRLYNSVGQLLLSAEAESETYKTNVESGVLIVNVNGVSTKVYVK